MKYLRDFLETAPHPTDKTDKSPPPPLLSALSVTEGRVSKTRTPENRLSEVLPPSELCSECGRAAWLSLVATDGTRTCFDCLTGRTAMHARGGPL